MFCGSDRGDKHCVGGGLCGAVGGPYVRISCVTAPDEQKRSHIVPETFLVLINVS